MRRGFSIIELVVVIVVLLVLVGIFIPIRMHSKVDSRLMYEGINQRNTHVAMTLHAATNKGYFPGLASAGDYIAKPFQGDYYGALPNANNAAEEKDGAGCTLSAGANLAYAMLLEDGSINPAQMLSPGETGQTSAIPSRLVNQVEPNPAKGTKVAPAGPGLPAAPGEVRDAHSSFAMLAYGRQSLKPEWNLTQNSQAVVLATRLIFNAKTGAFNTVWTDAGSGRFQGAVVRNDSSTCREQFAFGALSSSSNPFASLHYGPVSATNPAFIPATESSTVVGVFGRSTDMKNFGATPTAGQIGGAND